MKSLGSIFPVLAFVLAALFATGTGPASAAEPLKKHLQLQDEASRLYQALTSKRCPWPSRLWHWRSRNSARTASRQVSRLPALA